MGPLVSVILTSYNHEKFVGQAIESVLIQTYTNFELFIVDDCSTDLSWDIINSYDDPRIVVIRNKENMRISGWSSSALNKAEGKYIAIHHSDDVWAPDKLQKQVGFLEEHKEYGAVFSLARIIDEKNNEIVGDINYYTRGVFNQSNRSRYEWLNQFFHKGNVLCHPSVLIRRELYGKLHLIEYGYGQIIDLLQWIKLCLHTEIWIIQEKLVSFRILDNERNTSGDRPEAQVRSTIEIYRILRSFLQIKDPADMLMVFPETEKYLIDGQMVTEFAYAMLCLGHVSIPYRLFGLQLLFDLINESEKAEKIKKLYNYNHMSLIADTGEKDIFNICDGSFIPKAGVIGRVYYHYGDGYSAENYFSCEGLWQEGRYKYEVNIPTSLIERGKLKAIRFDPIEGAASRIKIISYKSNLPLFQLTPVTLSCKDAEWDEFYNTDPIYEISGDVDKIEHFEVVLELEGIRLKTAVQKLQTDLWILQETNKQFLTHENEELIKLRETENQINTTNLKLYEMINQLNEKNQWIERSRFELQQSQDSLVQSRSLLEQKEKDVMRLESEIFKIQNSISWKITKPFRLIKKI